MRVPSSFRFPADAHGVPFLTVPKKISEQIGEPFDLEV
jgi:hypothetical protein